jgi:hypothetical protein
LFGPSSWATVNSFDGRWEGYLTLKDASGPTCPVGVIPKYMVITNGQFDIGLHKSWQIHVRGSVASNGVVNGFSTSPAGGNSFKGQISNNTLTGEIVVSSSINGGCVFNIVLYRK